MTLCFSAGTVFVSALTGSGVLVAGLGGSEDSWRIILLVYTCFSISYGFTMIMEKEPYYVCAYLLLLDG